MQATGVQSPRSGLEVHSPAWISGRYADVPLGIIEDEYAINGLVAAAASCPCLWLWDEEPDTSVLSGQLLLIPDEVCSQSCTVEYASCAAARYNMTGLIVSERFASANASVSTAGTRPSESSAREWVQAERLAYTRRAHDLGCDGLPGSYVSNDTSALLYGSVNWTDRVGLLPAVLEAAAVATLNASRGLAALLANASAGNATGHTVVFSGSLDALEAQLDAVIASPAEAAALASSTALLRNRSAAAFANGTLAWKTGLNATYLNVTLGEMQPEEMADCSRFRIVPWVYMIVTPIWAGLWARWVWQTHHMAAPHALDVHRLMTWVPLIETVHGFLSFINYLSCPWTSMLAIVSTTFWSILTILKEPVLLLCLLLVAKGWGVTRHTLPRREVCCAGAIFVLLYASVSVQMSINSPAARVRCTTPRLHHPAATPFPPPPHPPFLLLLTPSCSFPPSPGDRPPRLVGAHDPHVLCHPCRGPLVHAEQPRHPLAPARSSTSPRSGHGHHGHARPSQVRHVLSLSWGRPPLRLSRDSHPLSL